MEAAATALKNEGNAKFAAGDVSSAIDAYKRGLTLLNAAEDSVTVLTELRVLLLSNLSNAHLSDGNCQASWEAAQAATRADPTAWKPWLRFIEARRRGGYPFDAFVHSLRHLRPLLRKEKEANRMSAADVAATLSAVEEPLCGKLAILRLSPDIELVDYAGGVAMVARRLFQPKDVLFVEHKYTRTDFEEDALHDQTDLTTEDIVSYFAERLRPEQVADTEGWRAFKRDFTGAWPRSSAEVDADTRNTVGSRLQADFPDLEEPAFSELLHIGLMCRYNCFHAGFFRVCALANHSCRANVAMKYNPMIEAVTMLVVSPVQPGEMMNVKYLSDAHFFLGVGRRRELLRSWLFWCQCERCGSDMQPGAITEIVRCPSCGAFSHAAMVGYQTASDPMLPTSEPCRQCKEPIVWTAAQRGLLRDLMGIFPQSLNLCGTEEVAVWMREQLTQTAKLRIHPEHWVYRILFYFYAVAITGIIDRVLGRVGESVISQSTLNEIKGLLSPYGLRELYLQQCAAVLAEPDVAGEVSREAIINATESEEGGSEALKALLIIWHLMVPFYPLNQMWSINDGICKLVLLHLIYPVPGATLSPAMALAVLQQHGHYIGESSQASVLHCYNRHKTTFNAKEPLLLAKIKKALKGG